MLRILTSIFLFACATDLWARSISLSLEDAGAHVISHNPSLAAARLRIEEARGRLHQSGRLSNPEVESAIVQSIRTPERSFELGFTQRFPLTARLRLEKDVSRAELAAAEQEVLDEQRRLVSAARTLVVRLLAIEAQRELRNTQLANSREIAEFTRKRVEAAEASTTDVLLFELEARQIEAELLQLGVEHTTLLGELRPQLGLTPADDIVVRGNLATPRAIPRAGVNVDDRPDLRAARANVDAARSAAALARAQKWQDVGVGLSAQSENTEDAPEGFKRDEFIGFRFSLPLPLWNNNSGRIREADAAAARRAREVDALALGIRSEVETARGEMMALTKVISTIDETLLPQARLVEEQLRTAYSAGQSTLTEVLRARDRRLLIERQRVDAVRDFQLARVRYDAAVGRGIPHSNLISKERNGK